MKKLLELEIEMVQMEMRDYADKVSAGKINPYIVRIADIEQAIKEASNQREDNYFPKRFKTCAESIRKEWSQRNLHLNPICLDIMVRLLNFFGPFKDWKDFVEKHKNHPYAKACEKYLDKSFWQLSPKDRLELKALSELRANELVVSIRIPESTLQGFDIAREKRWVEQPPESNGNTRIKETYGKKMIISHTFSLINNFIKPTPDALDLRVTGIKFYALEQWSDWDVLEREDNKNN